MKIKLEGSLHSKYTGKGTKQKKLHHFAASLCPSRFIKTFVSMDNHNDVDDFDDFIYSESKYWWSLDDMIVCPWTLKNTSLSSTEVKVKTSRSKWCARQ